MCVRVCEVARLATKNRKAMTIGKPKVNKTRSRKSRDYIGLTEEAQYFPVLRFVFLGFSYVFIVVRFFVMSLVTCVCECVSV